MEDILSIYKGKNAGQLPTPCFVINEAKFNQNCKTMIENVNELSTVTGKEIQFRPHVKTHKTAIGTLKQLGHGIVDKPFDAILISTIKEATGLLDHQEQMSKKYIKDIAFTLPACIPEYLTQLQNIAKRVDHLRIFVDHPKHIDNLLEFGKPSDDKTWSVFLKIDMGTKRAGVVPKSDTFKQIIEKFNDPNVFKCIELYGIYAHAGHSYASNNIVEAHQLLLEEIKSVNETALLIGNSIPNFDLSKLVLSVGATPTSNSLRLRDEPQLIHYIKNELVSTLEIHCGNYCLYDLQQVSTGCVSAEEISGFVLGSVVSSYKERNEILTNTGVMSLTRELSKYKGHGLCIPLASMPLSDSKYTINWYVDRVSQEHGILKPFNNKDIDTTMLPIGSKIAILPQHACITMGQFPYFFILDNENNVVDVWYPYQKW